MTILTSKPSLFLQPIGGCNEHHIGSNATLIVSGWFKDGRLQGDGILIDLGSSPPGCGPGGQIAQPVPDLRTLLSVHSPVKLRGIFLSHAESDHTEGILRYLEHGFVLPTIYGSAHTLYLLKQTLHRAAINSKKWPDMLALDPQVTRLCAGMGITPIPMGHSQPSFAYHIQKGATGIFVSSDFKIDSTALTSATSTTLLTRLAREKPISLLTLDSTRALLDANLPSESQVRDNLLATAQAAADQRLTIVISGNHLEGAARAVWLAGQTGRLLVHHGRSAERLLRSFPYAGLDVKKISGTEDLAIAKHDTQRAQDVPPHQVLNLLAGAQGEPSALLTRLSAGEQTSLQLGEKDTLIISASIHPQRRERLSRLCTELMQRGVGNILLGRSANDEPLHTSCHAPKPQLRALARILRPRAAILGLHGTTLQRESVRHLFNREGGTKSLRADNGTILRVDREKVDVIYSETLPLLDLPLRPSHPFVQAILRSA